MIPRPNRESAREAADTPPLDPAVLARAEALVASLRERYPELAARSLEELNACWSAIRIAPHDPTQKDRRDALFHLAHDFKGIGGSYGYPLVSAIGDSLCKLLRSEAAMDKARHDAIGRHVAALNAVIAERLSGDGGERGRLLVAALAKQVPARHIP